MRNRAWEMAIGFAFVVIGCILLWDAFDNRGKKMPWPISGLQPW